MKLIHEIFAHMIANLLNLGLILLSVKVLPRWLTKIKAKIPENTSAIISPKIPEIIENNPKYLAGMILLTLSMNKFNFSIIS
jgi:hypothetical protein